MADLQRESRLKRRWTPPEPPEDPGAPEPSWNRLQEYCDKEVKAVSALEMARQVAVHECLEHHWSAKGAQKGRNASEHAAPVDAVPGLRA